MKLIFVMTLTASTYIMQASSFGDVDLKNKVVSDINVLGSFRCENSSATEVTVTGKANINRCKFAYFTVIGGTQVKDSEVSGDTIITGELSAKALKGNRLSVIGPLFLEDSEIKEIRVNATEISLETTKVDSLHVECDRKREPIVYLKQSLVGRIVFQGLCPGIVYSSDPGSKNIVVENGKVKPFSTL